MEGKVEEKPKDKNGKFGIKDTIFCVVLLVIGGFICNYAIKKDNIKKQVTSEVNSINTEANRQMQQILKLNGNNASTYLIGFNRGLDIVNAQIIKYQEKDTLTFGTKNEEKKEKLKKVILVNQKLLNMLNDSAIVNINRDIDSLIKK